MNASLLYQCSGRWLVGLIVAATIAAAAFATPLWLAEESNAALETPTLAGPTTDPGGGGCCG